MIKTQRDCFQVAQRTRSIEIGNSWQLSKESKTAINQKLALDKIIE